MNKKCEEEIGTGARNAQRLHDTELIVSGACTYTYQRNKGFNQLQWLQIYTGTHTCKRPASFNSKHVQLYTASPLNDVQVDSIISSFHYTASERNPSYNTAEISNPYYTQQKCHYKQSMKHPKDTAEQQECTIGPGEP